MKKRISAALLSVVLCLAMVGTAWAAGGTVTVSAKTNGVNATVTAEGLTPNQTYYMCSISSNGELLALFDATANENGTYHGDIPIGTMPAGTKLTVNIPNPESTGAPITGEGEVKEDHTPSVTYTITFNANGGAVTPGSGVTGADGKLTSLPTPTRSGYTFDGWFTQASGGARVTTSTVFTANDTIYAHWTYTGGGGGSTGGGGGGGGSGSSSSSSKAPSVSKNTGGTVKVSSDGKTVTITPNDGYRVKDVLINGESVGAVTRYVFDKASKDNTVKVVFEKITDETRPAVSVDQFTDVSGHWARSAIAFAVERGLFNGVSDTQFAPDATMTRAMLVTVLYRLEGEPAGGTASFADVPAGQWYTQAVAWASGEGIVQGTGSGFEPNGNITREQLAAILYRYAALKGADVTVKGDMSRFPDAGSISPWASEAMSWAVGAGILSGSDAGALNPAGNATRAEVATMLMRFVNFAG